MATRPPWCQDLACTPGSNTVSPNDTEGTSAFCCGQMTEPVEVTYHGVKHSNDRHWCFRSPGRGVVMLEVNEWDLDLILRVTAKAITAADPDRKFNLRWYGLEAS